jgi:hypothetical protein
MSVSKRRISAGPPFVTSLALEGHVLDGIRAVMWRCPGIPFPKLKKPYNYKCQATGAELVSTGWSHYFRISTKQQIDESHAPAEIWQRSREVAEL